MKTKYIAVRGVLSFLSAAAAFSLASCGNAGNENTTASSEATAVEEVTTEEAIEIPEKYSLADENKITPYKNQHQSGLCWAYTTTSIAESSLIVSGFEDTSVDLSEGYICYRVYPFAEERAAGSTADGIYISGDPKVNKMTPYYVGGSIMMAGQLFALGDGPLYEDAAPINTEAGKLEKSVDIIRSLDEEGNFTKDMSKYLLTEMNLYREDEDIKEAILRHGAVGIGIYADQAGAGKTAEAGINYYLTDKSTPPEATNHVVTIIGWDDSYSKDNFTNKPAHDGAWLIKDSLNSLGDEYYWMSYDEYHDENGAVGMVFSKREDYGEILSYDTAGPADFLTAEGDFTTVANVFSARSADSLKAVGIETVVPDQKITVSVYKKPEKDNPDSGEKVYEKDYDIEYAGYKVIDLDEAVSLGAGEQFSVVVKYTNIPDAPGIAPIEGDASYIDLGTLGEVYLVSGEGESFALAGDKWYDLSKSESSAAFGKTGTLNNVCIKAILNK